MAFLFGRKPAAAPDAVDLVCRSLVDRWYEWEPFRCETDGSPGLNNPAAAVSLIYDATGVWMGTYVPDGTSDTPGVTLPKVVSRHDADRLLAAVRAHQAARLAPRPDPDAVAAALARAVLAGEATAARALKDRLQELQDAGRF
jgi:hypothetical protein